ncbi:MAG: hypothetical protein AB7K64_15445 [Variibacter sp.]
MSMSQPTDKIPNGPGAAAILAAGIGCAMIGILAFAAEAAKPVANALNIYKPVGPLAGKTTLAIIVWLVAWFILSRLWQNKTVAMNSVNVAAFVLLGIGFLLTFPPFWALFLGAR